jgi:hypothetical protein
MSGTSTPDGIPLLPYPHAPNSQTDPGEAIAHLERSATTTTNSSTSSNSDSAEKPTHLLVKVLSNLASDDLESSEPLLDRLRSKWALIVSALCFVCALVAGAIGASSHNINNGFQTASCFVGAATYFFEIYKHDVDSRTLRKLLPAAESEGDMGVGGCLCGVP